MSTLSSELRDLIRAHLARTRNAKERAALLCELVREVYRHATNETQGSGLDGADSDERAAIAIVVDAAEEHLDATRAQHFGINS